MDVYVYVCVCVGVKFTDDMELPGVEVLMPDITFVEEQKDKLAGLVITHAHEDHIGAIPWLIQRISCPIYATPFTVAMIERKLNDAGLLGCVELHAIPVTESFTVCVPLV